MILSREEKETLRRIDDGGQQLTVGRDDVTVAMSRLSDLGLVKIIRTKDATYVRLTSLGRAELRENPELKPDEEDRRRFWKWLIPIIATLIAALIGELFNALK